MPKQPTIRETSPAAALLAEARAEYGTATERQARAEEAPRWQHDVQVAAIESAQAQ